MNLPFTQSQFFEVFTAYNNAIWPVTILFVAAAVAALVLLSAKVASAARFTVWLLALYWAWMGVVYHILFFRRINPAAALFGLLFVVQGILFALAAARGKLEIGAPRGWRGAVGAVLAAYGLIVYPLIGALSGHVYPRAPTFGVAPCPTTIFTFGLLLWSRSRVPFYLWVIPVLWGAVGTSAAVALGVPEDYGLGVAALITAVILLAAPVRETQSEAVA